MYGRENIKTSHSSSITSALYRYGLVGFSFASLNTGIIYVGTEVLNQTYLLSACATIPVSVPASYLAHIKYTFESKATHSPIRVIKFITAQILQFILGLSLLSLFVEFFRLPPWVAMIATIVTIYIAGFFINAKWVFGHLKKSKHQ